MKGSLIIDCFAGGGGASVGIEMALGRFVDIAINHDPEAIRMHTVNHPDTIHLTEDIFQVDLQKYIKGRHVALMWASPDCTSHSRAKGGRPRKQGLRRQSINTQRTSYRMSSSWKMWRKYSSGGRLIQMGIQFRREKGRITGNLLRP